MALVPRFDIRVVDTTGKPIEDALVTVRRDARADAMPSRFEPQRRVYFFDQIGQGPWLIRAEPGPSRRELEPQEREATVTERGLRETFVLGRAGLPFYYRGKARVPFDLPEMIAVAVKPEATREIPALIERANSAGLREVPLPDALSRHYIHVFRADPERNAAVALEVELAAEGFVMHVGRVVRLDQNGVSFLTGEYIVKLQRGVKVAQGAQARNLEVVRALRSSENGFLLRGRGRSSIDVLQVFNTWAEDPSVIWAEPNLFTTAVPHETAPKSLPVQQGHHLLIQSSKAWATVGQATSSGRAGKVVIAVTDQGCDLDHPDLKPKILGYFNFNSHDMSRDDDPHGTKACGVAAGTPNTTKGVRVEGVAPMCDLIVARRGNTDDDYANMFEWCAGLGGDYYGIGMPAPLLNGADVISNSWGRSDLILPSNVGDALDSVAASGRAGRGCVVVFSVGNDGDDYAFHYPLLEHEAVIRVSASTISPPDAAEILVSDSNYGSLVDVCAPGGDLNAGGALVLAPTAAFDYSKTGYASFGQTSCACAQVAGVAALILVVKPHFTAEDVRDKLQQAASQIDAANPNAPYLNGRSMFYGFGRVDAGAAVK